MTKRSNKLPVGSTRRNVKSSSAPTIVAEPSQFAEEILDVFGSEFRFDHAKGLAEWMKNSADAYSTSTAAAESEHFILLRFKLGKPKKNSVFECIDFVGMSSNDIDSAFKKWGSATASKRGKEVATFGGHGNGGKFYMRQMFARAYFVTYRDGRLNIFGFNDAKKYGYAKDTKNVKCSLEEALAAAGLSEITLPDAVRTRWKTEPKNAGFTVVRGEQPEKFTGRSTVESILERIRLHPQTRRILRHKHVVFLPDGASWGTRIELPPIAPRAGFETPREYPLPASFDIDGEKFVVPSHPLGTSKLILRTSEVPLTRNSSLAAVNTIDVMGEVGCIGSYRMNELGFMRNAPETEFIMGELDAPFLELPEVRSVKNDREKLIKNEITDAVLDWVRNCVESLAEEMAKKTETERQVQDLQTSAAFNVLLDSWKNRFMQKLQSELFGGRGVGDAFGGSGSGPGGGGGAAGPHGEGKGSGDGAGSSGGDEPGAGTGPSDGDRGGSGNQRKSGGARFPRVLLTGHDIDPLSETGEKVVADPRHPPVYQRPIVDVEAGIYWINTQRDFARRILESEGAESVRWREYLFQRYVDIILKQAVYSQAKQNPDLRPEDLDHLIDHVTGMVHEAAAADLETFLFAPNVSVASSDAPEGGAVLE